MIDQADVITIRVPFPQIDSGLAMHSHMFICMENKAQKKFIKSQTFKPSHLMANKEPYHCIIESANIERNPFLKKTTIDCDKSFCVDNVTIDSKLLTKRRKNVCEELFKDIQERIKHEFFTEKVLDASEFLSLNKDATSTT